MTTQEGFPVSDKVAERTRQQAEEVGHDAALTAANFLIEYVGEGRPLSREAYGVILASKRQTAAVRYAAEREAGLHNDKYSSAAGLTAIIWLNGERFSVQELNAEQREFTSPLVEQIGEVENQPLYSMRLPEGLFEESNVGIRFLTRGIVDGHGLVHATAKDSSFILYHTSVVRIEGDEGDLWQNPDYNPDGTRPITY